MDFTDLYFLYFCEIRAIRGVFLFEHQPQGGTREVCHLKLLVEIDRVSGTDFGAARAMNTAVQIENHLEFLDRLLPFRGRRIRRAGRLQQDFNRFRRAQALQPTQRFGFMRGVPRKPTATGVFTKG
jgi:hypothetical protein